MGESIIDIQHVGYEIYFHVHQLGSPEIDVEGFFNSSWHRKQYEQVKIMSSKFTGASEKIETGMMSRIGRLIL